MKVMESSANGGAKFRACFVGHAGNAENESNILSPAFEKIWYLFSTRDGDKDEYNPESWLKCEISEKYLILSWTELDTEN